MKTASNFLNSPAWVNAVQVLFGTQTAKQLNERAENAARFANEDSGYSLEPVQVELSERRRFERPDFPINMEREGH